MYSLRSILVVELCSVLIVPGLETDFGLIIGFRHYWSTQFFRNEIDLNHIVAWTLLGAEGAAA